MHDSDLEAANLVFHDPRSLDRLPFRLTGHEIRFPFGHAVRKVLATPSAATTDGWVHGSIVVDLLLEDGIALTPEDRRDLEALPILPFSEVRGRRCAAFVRRRALLDRKAELAHEQRMAPNEPGLVAEERRINVELDAIRGFLADPSRLGDPNLARFVPDQTSITYVFESAPRIREMLIEGLMPAAESGLLVARGGGGKGHLQQAINVSLALGLPFGPFQIEKPRGVVIVTVEDDREEMHHRLTAALDARFSDSPLDWRRDFRDVLERRIRIVDLRGTTGVALGPDLREMLLPVVEMVENPGLIWLDPLARLLPKNSPPGFLNSQEGAGFVLNELDALRTATGCTPLASHHVNKSAIRDGGELQAGAATGSQLLADLSRWVLNLKPLTPSEAFEYGLGPGHYIETAVVKSNYTPPLDAPLVFQRVSGGALRHLTVATKTEQIDSVMLKILIDGKSWIAASVWDEWGRAADLTKAGVAGARKRLVQDRKAVEVEVREGRQYRNVYAPSDWAVRGFPRQPTSIAEIEALEAEAEDR